MNAVTMQISKATARLETGSNVVYVRPSSTVLPICLHLPIRNALTTDDAGANGLVEIEVDFNLSPLLARAQATASTLHLRHNRRTRVIPVALLRKLLSHRRADQPLLCFPGYQLVIRLEPLQFR